MSAKEDSSSNPAGFIKSKAWTLQQVWEDLFFFFNEMRKHPSIQARPLIVGQLSEMTIENVEN